MSETLQARAIPNVSSWEDRGGFGFVYFDELNYEGQSVRVGWLGQTETKEEGYLFAANWGECHVGHFAAAHEALARQDIQGFEKGEEATVRIDVGDNVQQYPLYVLKNAATKEHRAFIAKLKRMAKAGRK